MDTPLNHKIWFQYFPPWAFVIRCAWACLFSSVFHSILVPTATHCSFSNAMDCCLNPCFDLLPMNLVLSNPWPGLKIKYSFIRSFPSVIFCFPCRSISVQPFSSWDQSDCRESQSFENSWTARQRTYRSLESWARSSRNTPEKTSATIYSIHRRKSSRSSSKWIKQILPRWKRLSESKGTSSR